MKRLYIVRHAKSSWSNAELSDHDRPLNKRGKRDAPIVAARLSRAGHRPDIIISSTARRARKTAKILANELSYPVPEIVQTERMYLARVSTLLQLIGSLDDEYASAMIVGHNPALTTLVDTLSAADLDNLPTSGVFCIQLPIDSWRNIRPGMNAPVPYYDYPKKSVD